MKAYLFVVFVVFLLVFALRFFIKPVYIAGSYEVQNEEYIEQYIIDHEGDTK